MVVLAAVLAVGCASSRPSASGRAPAGQLGAFVDDYGGTHEISTSQWRHGARNTYELVAWFPDSQFVIARNAATNPSAAGLWTRIDWVRLEDMPPYAWAFCLSAYRAPSREAAQTTRAANRSQPRTGCNGFPFSRMRPAGTTAPP